MELTTTQYEINTQPYNEKRYGRPWAALCVTSLVKDLSFIDWDGRPGYAGEFTFDEEPGTIIARGQKDLRNGKGGIDSYRVCMPDGRLPLMSDVQVRELWKIKDLTKRVRRCAEMRVSGCVAEVANLTTLIGAGAPAGASVYVIKQYDEWQERLDAQRKQVEYYSLLAGMPNPFTRAV